jgi:hypothetical protein
MKRRSTSTRLHSATSQKAVIILAAVRTWNLTFKVSSTGAECGFRGDATAVRSEHALYVAWTDTHHRVLSRHGQPTSHPTILISGATPRARSVTVLKGSASQEPWCGSEHTLRGACDENVFSWDVCHIAFEATRITTDKNLNVRQMLWINSFSSI